MQISHKRPPNYDKIVKVLPSASRLRSSILFCYGHTIYTLSYKPISPHLIAHEKVHCDRQGEDIEGWWDKYLNDPKFRFYEELLAHRAEYQSMVSDNANRLQKRSALKIVSKRLSSKLYGANSISVKQAQGLILNA